MLILREAVAAIESDFNLHLRVLRDLESIRKELQDPGLDMRRLIRVTEKLGDMVQDIIAAEKRSTYRVKALKENADVLDTPPDKRGPEEDPLR